MLLTKIYHSLLANTKVFFEEPYIHNTMVHEYGNTIFGPYYSRITVCKCPLQFPIKVCKCQFLFVCLQYLLYPLRNHWLQSDMHTNQWAARKYSRGECSRA